MNDASAMTTSLDEAGRIVLPPLVLSQLGVKPGDELALQEIVLAIDLLRGRLMEPHNK